ncbi:MAG: formyltransferase family protein [Alphaproteobacteria bacterium]|nr:formyltransferase family protein [Alphaproteobacteria bacterium]
MGHSIRILFFGYSQLGYDAVQFLNRTYHLVGVVTHLPNSGYTEPFPLVSDYAKQHNIPVFTPSQPDLGTFTQTFRDLAPDLILSVYYRYLIPVEILQIPTLGAYNMHGSYLPHFRGCAPINWAIIKGAKTTGVTLHEMVAKPDAGAIIDQRSCSIDLDDTAGMLSEKMRPLSLDILKAALPQIINGTCVKQSLDVKQGSYFGRRTPKDGCIDPKVQTAQQVRDLVRALQPATHYPPAYLETPAGHLLIHDVSVASEPPALKLHENIPHVYTDTEGALWVSCLDDTWVKINRSTQN